jgi:transposase
MSEHELRVALDIGSKKHRVGIATDDGKLVEEFDITHDRAGFDFFFSRVEARRNDMSVVVAMEGLNGWARPLDRMIQKRDYELLNVNNVKLARFKEIFPGPAKTDKIDTRKTLELIHVRKVLPLAKTVLHRVGHTPVENDQLKRYTRRRRQGPCAGFGSISSATLAGEIGNLDRFEAETSLALYSGMTRLDNSSGQFTGSKNTRQVNTHARAALMVAVGRHIDNVPESKTYYDKKKAEGKTHNQAVRALGRHLIRVIWSMIKNDRDYVPKSERLSKIA